MIEYEIHFEKVPNDNAAENKSGYEAGYEQASNDIWAMACDIYGMSGEELVKAFYDCCGCIPLMKALKRLSLTITNTRPEKQKKPKTQSSMLAMKLLTVLEMSVLSQTLIRPFM